MPLRESKYKESIRKDINLQTEESQIDESIDKAAEIKNALLDLYLGLKVRNKTEIQ